MTENEHYLVVLKGSAKVCWVSDNDALTLKLESTFYNGFVVRITVVAVVVFFMHLLLLVGWVLWHINLCRLFNAKSIFKQISVLFQTIQFRINTQFKCKYSLIVKYISISSYSV